MGTLNEFEAAFEAGLTPREHEQWRQVKAGATPVDPGEVLRLRQQREAWERAAREYVDGKITPAELAKRAANGV